MKLKHLFLIPLVLLSQMAGADPQKDHKRALFFYDSVRGLHAYEFDSGEFRFHGRFTSSNSEQHVRALEFAVCPADQTIVAADGQATSYPIYSLDFRRKHLSLVEHADGFLYGSVSFNPKNGLLYGTLWRGPHRDVLAIIDPKTGGVHELGRIVTGANIAFDPDGVLYAVISGGYLNDGIENGQLYRIDLETLKHELVGAADIDKASSSFTIDSRGIGYVMTHPGMLHQVDLRTAESRLIGDSGCRSVFGMFEYKVGPEALQPFVGQHDE